MKRQLTKTLSWSLLAFTVTTVVGYMMTGDWIKGGTIGLLCRAIKVPAYWWHDGLYAKHWPSVPDVPAIVDDVPAEWKVSEYHAHQLAYREHCQAG